MSNLSDFCVIDCWWPVCLWWPGIPPDSVKLETDTSALLGYQNLQKTSGVRLGANARGLSLPQRIVFLNIKDPVLKIKEDETHFCGLLKALRI